MTLTLPLISPAAWATCGLSARLLVLFSETPSLHVWGVTVASHMALVAG